MMSVYSNLHIETLEALLVIHSKNLLRMYNDPQVKTSKIKQVEAIITEIRGVIEKTKDITSRRDG